jgi:hypothetical protein
MMTVKITRADGGIEAFETANYIVGKARLFHPMILKVELFCGQKRIARRKRAFCLFYKLFTFKTKKVQDILKTELKNAETKNPPEKSAE